MKEENNDTFSIPSLQEVERCILTAKIDAVRRSNECGIILEQYSDQDLLFPANEPVCIAAVQNDYEDEFEENDFDLDNIPLSENAAIINEDITLLKQKTDLPTYAPSVSVNQSQQSRRYMLNNKAGKSQFVKYKGVFIRKSTALYLLQERNQLSNDRLLRVRSTQSSHLYTGGNGDDSFDSGHQKKVNSGDMCVFKRIDCEKVIIGRVIQFSYLDGGKRERQYSSSYVDMSLESHKNIGVFANWFKAFNISRETVSFKPHDAFTIGYLSMDRYVCTIVEIESGNLEDESFSIAVPVLSDVLPSWKTILSSDADFD